MIDQPLPPDPQPEWDRQLWMMILASGILHTLILAAILLFPKAWLHRAPPPPISYTVDLIAPNKLGGSNIVPGGKGRVQAAPMVAAAPPKEEAPKPEPPKPAAPKVEEVKPPIEVKPPEPAKVEPPKPEAPKVEVKEIPKPPEPKPEAVKVEPKPKEDSLALADKAKKPSPPVPTVAKAQPSPKAAAPPTANAVAKVEAAKPLPTLPKVDPKAAVEAKKAADAKAAAEAKAAADAKAAAEKAAAEKAAADKAAKEIAERDSQISAAIRRVQQKGERGGGLGASPQAQPGGAIAAGPGEGVGGQVMGVEYLLYYNQTIHRIRDSWAWAGTNEALEATLHFSITDSGEIVDVKITKSSGDKSFDLSAERAVRAVSPLPPPPEQFRKDFADFELVFSPRDLKM